MKDRSMATAAYPMAAVARPVKLEGSWCGGGYRTRTVGKIGVVKMSDNTEVICCNNPHGHKKSETLTACVTRKVSSLNDLAGIPADVR